MRNSPHQEKVLAEIMARLQRDIPAISIADESPSKYIVSYLFQIIFSAAFLLSEKITNTGLALLPVE